jgi:hypothetical protein
VGFGDLIGSFLSNLQNFLQSVLDFLHRLVQAIADAFRAVGEAIGSVFHYGLKALQSVGTFFKHLWDGFFKNIFTGIMKALSKLHKFLETKLRPLINFLKKVRAFVDRYYKKYIRPYLQMLQRVRRWLAVLKLFHIKFAETLDRRLAQTEAAIAHQFLLVRGVLNDVLNFVNAVADPRRLSRMVLVSIAGRRTAAAVVRAVTGLPIGFFFPHTGKGAFPFEKPVTSHAQLVDPSINQPVSGILAGLLPLPVDGFEDVDPTPDSSELDALETSPFFGTLGDALLDAEIAMDAIPDVPVSLLDAIQNRTGLIADATKSFGQLANE